MSEDGSKARGWSLIDLKALQFGPGVVGRTTTMIAIIALALAGVVYSIPNVWLGGAAVLAIVGLGLYAVKKIFAFADKYPELATLENSQIVKYKQIEYAAKGIPKPLPTPNTSPPPLIEIKKRGKD